MGEGGKYVLSYHYELSNVYALLHLESEKPLWCRYPSSHIAEETKTLNVKAMSHS